MGDVLRRRKPIRKLKRLRKPTIVVKQTTSSMNKMTTLSTAPSSTYDDFHKITILGLPDDLLIEVFSWIANRRSYVICRSVCLHWSIVLDSKFVKSLVFRNDVANNSLFKPLHGEVPWDILFQWSSVHMDEERRSRFADRLALQGVPKHVKLIREVVPNDLISFSENEHVFYKVKSIRRVADPLTERSYRRDQCFELLISDLHHGGECLHHYYGLDTCVFVTPEPWHYKKIRILHGAENKRSFFFHQTSSQPIVSINMSKSKFTSMLADCETFVNLYSTKRNIAVILECFVRGPQEIEPVGFCVRYVRKKRQKKS
mmetsp:Transcript_7962/g.11821  ORF Transcript_7962/g.11821 Transcript_7962/m.11821 type:complete len:315 (+) Transcript_7962:21-965(+)